MLKKILPAITILVFILIGLFLRLRGWPDYLSFGFEQANDAVVSTNIYSLKNITLLGPMTEIEGVFHSPVYYYIIGFIYFVFGKNPAWVSLFITITNLSCIPVIYLIGKNIFNKRVGIIASGLFAISYETISYSLWIANASVGLPFILLFFYFFYKSFKENQKYLPFSFFFFSLAISFELIIFMNIFAIIALCFIYNKKRISIKNIILSLVSFVIPLITYPVFEIKNKFLMTNKFISMVNSQGSDFKSIYRYLYFFFESLAKEFANVLFPVHGFIAGILMFMLFIYLYKKIKNKNLSGKPWFFILIWLFSSLPVFLINVSVTNSEYAFIGINAGIILIISVYVDELIKNKKTVFVIFLLILLVFANLKAWNNFLPNPQKRLFDSQRGIFLKDTLGVVDYTYQSSEGKPFFVHTVTVPLYVSKLWDYLYSWDGQEKYKYIPTKDGSAQIQYLISENGSDKTFEYFKQQKIEELNKTTTIEEKKQFGKITVEKRRLIKK